MSSLIDPREGYKHAFDLSIHHAIHPQGDIVAILTWNLLTERPALVLVPKGILSHDRVVPCVIPLDTAFLWDEKAGDEHHAMLTSAIFCSNLGYSPHNLKNVLKILSIIRDLLGDLLSMPPMPTETREVAAEMRVIDNATGKVTEKVVTDHA